MRSVFVIRIKFMQNFLLEKTSLRDHTFLVRNRNILLMLSTLKHCIEPTYKTLIIFYLNGEFFEFSRYNGFLFIIPFFLSLKYFLVKTFFHRWKWNENNNMYTFFSYNCLRHPPPLESIFFQWSTSFQQPIPPPFLKKRDKTNWFNFFLNI